MGVLKRVDKRIRSGLSANAVRLLTGEPAPRAPVYRPAVVQSEPEHFEKASKAQVNQRLRARTKKRTAKKRS